jgi:hypothetical protein
LERRLGSDASSSSTADRRTLVLVPLPSLILRRAVSLRCIPDQQQ